LTSEKFDRLFDIKKKTIILTGSAGFLGPHYADFLSSAGANVILVDINNIENKKLEQKLSKKYHTKPMAIQCNITDEKDVKKMKVQVMRKYKKIDALVNNAVFHPKIKNKNKAIALESFPLELWNNSIAVDLTGTFLCCREFGSVMKKQKKGSIINISSIYGLMGADQRIYGKSKLNSPISYAVTKGAIVNLTKYLAAYWYNTEIRVNTLSLGGVKDNAYMSSEFIKNYSKKTILGRMAEKSEYNGGLLFLISDASSYMTGSNLIIDGGWTAW
jgi:NAD(P)-dependent dehydrogenase (short-subunit alcohol dehydrogenase family)